MSLIGFGTLAVVIALALSAVVCTVACWEKAAALGVARWAVRGLMVFGCQLTAVLVVALSVNDVFVFYSSWGELLGQYRPATGYATRSGSMDGVLGPKLAANYRAERGTVVALAVPAADSGVRADPATVYLPPQYGDPAYSRRSFPVVELLSGFPGGPQSWLRASHISHVLDHLISTGESVPFIAVIPVQNVVSPRDTECVNVTRGPQVDTYLTIDVHRATAGAFRASSSPWGVLGVSTGGYCAANLAFRHPGLFGAAVSIAGYNVAAHDATTGSLFGGSRALADANNVLWQLQHHRAPALNLLVVSIRSDRASYRAGEQLARAHRPPLELWTLALPRGAHNFATFNAVLPTCFGWLSRLMPAPLTAIPSVDGVSPALHHQDALANHELSTPLVHAKKPVRRRYSAARRTPPASAHRRP